LDLKITVTDIRVWVLSSIKAT